MEEELSKSTDTAVAVIGEWQYNNCDICINPHEQGFTIGDMYAYIYTAQGHNGIWGFGESYNFGSFSGGRGVFCPVGGYHTTEEDTRKFGWLCLHNRAEERLKDLNLWKDNPHMENKGERELLEKMIEKMGTLMMPTLF